MNRQNPRNITILIGYAGGYQLLSASLSPIDKENNVLTAAVYVNIMKSGKNSSKVKVASTAAFALGDQRV